MTDNSPIDEKDRSLIGLLRHDARQPVSALARQLNMSRTGTQARLEKLERLGVIAGYTVRLGTSATAAEVRALVMIKAPAPRRRQIETALSRLTPVNSLYSVSGVFDLVAVISTRDVATLDQTLDQIGTIEGVTDTQSSLILSTKFDR